MVSKYEDNPSLPKLILTAPDSKDPGTAPTVVPQPLQQAIQKQFSFTSTFFGFAKPPA